METISPHLHRLEDTCSAYLINDGNNALMIDCGTHLTLESLQPFNVKTVESILLTHFHRDQCGAAAGFSANGTRLFLPFAERRYLEEADLQKAAYDTYNNYTSYFPAFSPLENLQGHYAADYTTIHWHNYHFQVIPLPGHTYGSVGYLFEVDGRKTLACGDLLSGADTIHEYFWSQWRYMDFQGHANVLASLETIMNMELDLILPGHGQAFAAETIQGHLRANLEELYELFYARPYAYFRPRFRQLTPHVYEVENSSANTYIIKDDAGHALIIDSGYVATSPITANPHRYVDNLTPYLATELGITQVEWFLPTHYHDDHLAGYPALKARYNTQVAASPELKDILEHPERYDMPCLLPEGIEVAQTVARDAVFVWRDISFTIEQFPGQTLYHQLITFNVDDTRFLCCGDNISGVCFSEKRDFIHSFIPKNRTPVSAYRDMPRQLLERQPDFLLTGHGGAVPFDQEKVERWQIWMDRWTELFSEIIDQPHPDMGMDPHWIEFYPYKVRIKPDATTHFVLKIKNHEARQSICQISLRSVEGVLITPTTALVTLAPLAQQEISLRVVFPSQFNTHSLPILADIIWNDRPLGEVAEAIAYW